MRMPHIACHPFFMHIHPILLRILLSLGILFFLASPQVAGAYDEPWYRNPWNREVSRAIDTLGTNKVQQLPIPILFGVTLADFGPNFGVPRSGGRTHEGQDILAPLGTPIVSPTRAVVTNIRYGASAGHSVYTAIPGGETLAYLHLDRVNPNLSEGDILNRGDLLGYVGDTGNASGGAAHLHFELLTDVANDPYPRITAEFTDFEKMSFTERMLQELPSDEKNKVLTFLLTTYRDVFTRAQAEGYIVPQEIVDQLNGTGPALTIDISSSQDLTVGDRGSDVTDLQQFLILTNVGGAASRLAEVGATGYYGTLTRNAVIEYQTMNSLSVTGVYDTQTRNHITSDEPTPEPIATVPITSAPTVSFAGMPEYNLTLGSRNDGVVWLQEYLIAQASGNNAFELANVGATGYFGPLTQRALAEFQALNGISPAVGYYGPVTREHILNI